MKRISSITVSGYRSFARDKVKSGISIARNPVIFSHATKEIPYRGLGTGIKRALELQPNIVFRNDPDGFTFTAIVPRTEQKVDIGRAKVDIGDEKVDIGGKKVDIEEPDDLANPTLENIRKLKAACGDAEYFRRNDVCRITGLAKAGASKLIARLLSRSLIRPVSGPGKGAYRFVGGDT